MLLPGAIGFSGPELLWRALFGSVTLPTVARVYIYVRGSGCHWRQIGCLAFGLLSGDMLLSEGHTTTDAYLGNLQCQLEPWWHLVQDALKDHVCGHGPTASWVCVDVYGLHCHQRPQGGPRIWAATCGHVGVRRLCCCLAHRNLSDISCHPGPWHATSLGCSESHVWVCSQGLCWFLRFVFTESSEDGAAQSRPHLSLAAALGRTGLCNLPG